MPALLSVRTSHQAAHLATMQFCSLFSTVLKAEDFSCGRGGGQSIHPFIVLGTNRKEGHGERPVPTAVAFSIPSQLTSKPHPRNSWKNNSYHPQGSLHFFLDELKPPLFLLASCTGCISRTPIKRNETWDKVPTTTN